MINRLRLISQFQLQMNNEYIRTKYYGLLIDIAITLVETISCIAVNVASYSYPVCIT